MILTIVIIGIVANFICLMEAASKEPEGTMGMGVFFLIGLIPYLLVILFGLSKIGDHFGWGK